MSTQNTHTPGPWTVNKSSPQAGIITAPNRSLGIAEVFGGGSENEANARLIASSPELLEELQKCADWLARSTRVDDREIAADARAAIAKARGGK